MAARQSGAVAARGQPTIKSVEIEGLQLLRHLPTLAHIYVAPFLLAYPAAIYVYTARYDELLGDQAFTFLLCLALIGSHGLSWLGTKWSTGYRAATTCIKSNDIRWAESIRVIPQRNRGQGDIVPLLRTPRPGAPPALFFMYQRDKFNYEPATHSFSRLAYPCDADPPLSEYQTARGLTTLGAVSAAKTDFGKNEFSIPVPTFRELFAEHAVAPFFIFQLFCVGLWCLDEYIWYSLFTLFMLGTFECTVVFQRLRTLNEFRTMTLKPYPVNVFRTGKWTEIISDDLLPGDLVSVVRNKEDQGVPCDLLLARGSCIVNEAMLSGESTPLLKESIELRPGSEKLDIQGADRNSVLFGGTKVLQATAPEAAPTSSQGDDPMSPPDGGCVALVLRTGFGSAQGQLIRTMIFSTDRVTANNWESFLFILFLLCFAIAASAYVWTKGVEQDRPRMKLLLDCVIIITSVVPPELPMELSLAVNSSLMALSKLAIFCTEPFRIPLAGRVDICCFDKTGTITGEDLLVEGVAGVDSADPRSLTAVAKTSLETTLTLAAAHALVLLDGGVIGDPMEKTTLDALGWQLSAGDQLAPVAEKAVSEHKAAITIKRRFQFSSALKRMSTVSTVRVQGGKQQVLVAVKGAPETLKTMYTDVPEGYESTYKWFAQRGSRVLALGYKFIQSDMSNAALNALDRSSVETKLTFAGFLVFHCPLKPDAVETLRQLNDASHRCIMITGDNPLTAVHVARDVEIVDRDVFILDVRDGASSETDLVWRNVDESKIIPVDPSEPLDQFLLRNHDICVTGAAVRQFADKPAWMDLVQRAWVYARVSPAQKELIVGTLKDLGYTVLMAGDGTNDVGALKRAHIGVALLNGSPELLQQIAERQKIERLKNMYEQQLRLTQRFNGPPPPVPPLIANLYPDIVKAQKAAAETHAVARAQSKPGNKFDLQAITSKMSDLEDDQDVPTIKLGDASWAAPFTSKLSNVNSIAMIIRQGRCTLVATIQMYKILALNCLISAYALSVMYLDGIKFGEAQMTVQGLLMSVCFLFLSRGKPVETLSKERPLGNIFNLYVLLSVLFQFAIHIVALIYISDLCELLDPRTEKVDLERDFKPSLLNSAIYLLSLSQQVSTFSVNYVGRPFREGIRENPAMFYGLLGCMAVSLNGATNFVPEVNSLLKLVPMSFAFRSRLTATIAIDYVGAYVIEKLFKRVLGDTAPRGIVVDGIERREKRRAAERETKKVLEAANGGVEVPAAVKKSQ